MNRSRYNDKKKRRNKNNGGSKFKRGFYQPVNENKYRAAVDKTMNSQIFPEYRSSWEKFYMQLLDHSDAVEYWGCEVLHIKYFDTQQNKIRRYFPDFFIKLKNGTKLVHEVKPKGQCKQQLNLDKWAAAEEYCRQAGMTFQVITEIELKQFGMKI